MPQHLHATHRIVVDAPVDRAFMFFTPAGEELWVDGWQPAYIHPRDGRTEAGMVFSTGEGAEHTVWILADFDRAAHRSRYLRCTPASRTGIVEVVLFGARRRPHPGERELHADGAECRG